MANNIPNEKAYDIELITESYARIQLERGTELRSDCAAKAGRWKIQLDLAERMGMCRDCAYWNWVPDGHGGYSSMGRCMRFAGEFEPEPAGFQLDGGSLYTTKDFGCTDFHQRGS